MAGVEADIGGLAKLAKEGPVDAPKALRAILGLLVSEGQAAFRNQGWRGGTRWEPRVAPNFPAVIRAAQGGASTWRPRWMDSTPALVDTGRLRGSIDGRVNEAEMSVEVGTNVPYARLHQDGGTVTLPGGKRGSPIRSKLAAILKTAPAEARRRLGWLFGVATVTLRVRRRPVIEITKPVLDDCRAIILRYSVGGKK